MYTTHTCTHTYTHTYIHIVCSRSEVAGSLNRKFEQEVLRQKNLINNIFAAKQV